MPDKEAPNSTPTPPAEEMPKSAPIPAVPKPTPAPVVNQEPKSTEKGINFEKILFIKAKHFTEVDNNRKPRVIVIHCMEAAEKSTTAENCAKYFHTMDDGRIASAHYCIDNDSIVQCVQCKDVAYGAKGCNRHGIHIELTGYEAQTAAQWRDPFSLATLQNAAELCAKVLCPKFNIEAKWLSPEDLKGLEKNKVTGFATHAMVTRAMGISGGHLDPGPAFPLNEFMDMVRREIAKQVS